MKIDQSLIPVIIACSCLALTGCQGTADTPKFTTHNDRSSDFEAKTFEEQHEMTNADNEELKKRIEEGINQVEKKSSDIQNEISQETDKIK